MKGFHFFHQWGGLIAARELFQRQELMQLVTKTAPPPLRTAVSRGSLPTLSVVSASALLLLAVVDNAARVGQATWPTVAFWFIMGMLFVPVALRLVRPDVSDSERLGLIVLLVTSLYLVKVLNSPLSFTLHDEFGQWRVADDIIQTHHLFADDPIGRAYPYFPGLQIVTTALVQLSGWSIFQVGIVLLGVMRITFAIALFQFFALTSSSTRIAGVATLLYTTNPNFVFFDAQYAYETLALTLVMFVLYLAVLWQRERTRRRAVSLLTCVVIGANVVTHHLATYTLTVVLLVWSTIECVLAWRMRRSHANNPAGFALVAFLLASGWAILVADIVVTYLIPVLNGAIREFIQFLTGHGPAKVPFSSTSSQRDPLVVQVLGFASVILILLSVPFGLWRLWARRRANALALTLAGGTLAYPVSLGLRLTQQGTETSNRASEYVFVGIGFVLALVIAEAWLPGRLHWPRMAMFATWSVAIFLGGISVGTAPYARLPGPYLVAADQRSIDPQGVAAAEWMRDARGVNNRMIADQTNGLLMGSYGKQAPQFRFRADDPYSVSEAIFSPGVGSFEQSILRGKEIQYIIIDDRLSQALPPTGIYFERSEPGAYRHAAPIDPQVLAKWDRIPVVSRIFDSGDIVIYDVRALATPR